MNASPDKTNIDPVWVKVAAADSPAAAKAMADFVCSGEHDEETIQRAIDLCAADGRNLYLFNGIYNIDAFRAWDDGGPRAALRLPPRRHFTLAGQDFFQAGSGMMPSGMNGVTLYLRRAAWETAGDGVPSVLRGTWTEHGSQNGSGLLMENISVFLCDAEHPARCIDLRRTDGAEVRNMRLRGMGERCMNGDSFPYMKFGPLPMPHIDAIGITMTGGSNLPHSRFDNIHATGFGQGFQAGGEHVICCNCLASFNLYGWTFGNYEFGTPRGAADNHPIVLINCGDEQSVHLPLFAHCGDNGGTIHGMQSVTMVGFNFERLSYAPFLGQQFFDTDLGKLLICTDPAKRLWVDTLGCPADANCAPS